MLLLNSSAEEVANAVDQAYGERLQQEINNKVLRKRGFTVESFLEKGKQKCTPSAYLSLCNRIDQVRFSLRFLICGFDAKKEGHIFSVDGDGTPKCYDDIGMWAIGTGASAALSSLAFHKNNLDFGLSSTEEEIVYFALAAKFMAESAGSVGKATFISVHRPGSELRYISYTDRLLVEKIWKVEGRPRCPDKLADRVKGIVKTREEAAQFDVSVKESIEKAEQESTQ
jgi:hypothetical protein